MSTYSPFPKSEKVDPENIKKMENGTKNEDFKNSINSFYFQKMNHSILNLGSNTKKLLMNKMRKKNDGVENLNQSKSSSVVISKLYRVSSRDKFDKPYEFSKRHNLKKQIER